MEATLARDPFELDRLARELEDRELGRDSVSSGTGSEYAIDDLPLLAPLSHSNSYLSAENFDLDAFLLSRSHTSLPDLRSELRDYLSTLKEELVKLINDDYEAFISLSTDLEGEGTRLQRLRFPLEGVKSQILQSKNSLQVVQDTIQETLRKRSAIREEKAILNLLLKISESVTRQEALLLITPPDNGPLPEESKSEFGTSLHIQGLDDDTIEERSQHNRPKHLGRVAAEYTQLLYHTSKARSENCAFVEEIQWRIDRIHSTLSTDLDHVFSSILLALSDGKRDVKKTEGEKAKLLSDLSECLRTYDLLGLWRDAEDVVRRDLVRGFIKKTIFAGALVAPRSPIVPQTPFPARGTDSLHSSNFGPLKTPFTPHSAFASKQSVFEVGHGLLQSRAPGAHLLDESEDPLAGLYNQILRFVERDLSKILDVAEKVSVKSNYRSIEHLGPGTNPEEHTAEIRGFAILANVVWADIGRALMEELGSVVFSSGRPSEFRKHYEITQAFARSLEYLAPSLRSVHQMRSHPVYLSFERRWQLPVYFQLRWKEIVAKVEETLSGPKVKTVAEKDGSPFATAQASVTWNAILTCWSADVYLPELGFRFWTLTLQILSRHRFWVKNLLATDSSGLKSPVNEKSAAAKFSQTGTPVLTDGPIEVDIAAEDSQLEQYSAIVADTHTLKTKMMKIWREEISMMLPDLRNVQDDSGIATLEASLEDSLAQLSTLIQPFSTKILSILSRRCCDALLPVRSIPSQFKAMSNKRPPTEPSYFVASILRPLKDFWAPNGPGERVPKGLSDSISAAVFDNVCQKYIFYLTVRKKTEESLKRLKKGKKQTFSLFGSSTNETDDLRDEERINAQMVQDVAALGENAETLGVKTGASPAFKLLTEMVNGDLTDGNID